jgi:hypothetical protein
MDVVRVSTGRLASPPAKPHAPTAHGDIVRATRGQIFAIREVDSRSSDAVRKIGHHADGNWNTQGRKESAATLMNHIRRSLSCSFCLLAVSLLHGPHNRALAQSPSPDEAVAIGIEAYVYGYPLVTMEYTRRVMTNMETVEGSADRSAASSV